MAFSSYCLFSVLILFVYSIFCVHYALHLPTLTLCLCDFFGRIVFCSVVRVPACLCDFSDASFDYMGASFDYICASFDYADAPFDCQRAALEHIGVVLTRLVSVHGSCSFTAVPRQAVPWNYPAIRVAALKRRLTFPARFLTASTRRLTTRTRRLTTPTRRNAPFAQEAGPVQTSRQRPSLRQGEQQKLSSTRRWERSLLKSGKFGAPLHRILREQVTLAAAA